MSSNIKEKPEEGKPLEVTNLIKNPVSKLNVNAKEFRPKKKVNYECKNEKNNPVPISSENAFVLFNYYMNMQGCCNDPNNYFIPRLYNYNPFEANVNSFYDTNNITKELYLEEEKDENIEDLDNYGEFILEFENCECCKGYPYNCNGSICRNLGVCHCKMHKNMNMINDQKISKLP